LPTKEFLRLKLMPEPRMLYCDNLASTYGVSPLFSNGTLSTNAIALSLWTILDCNVRAGNAAFTPRQCGQIVEALRYQSVSSLPDYYKSAWATGVCTTGNRARVYLYEKYAPKPFVADGYGSFPSDFIKPFFYGGASGYDCIAKGSTASGWTQYPAATTWNSAAVCSSWESTYNVVPFESSGTLPTCNLTWYDATNSGITQQCK
jgi:hypothetical protein